MFIRTYQLLDGQAGAQSCLSLRLNLRFAVANHRFEFHKRCQFFVLNDKRGVDLISDALPFGRLWYGEPNAVDNAIGDALHRSCSHDAVFRVYEEIANVIETHEHKGDFKEP
jgi:hypothetical protein